MTTEIAIAALIKEVLQTIAAWGINTTQQIIILGLPPDTIIDRYQINIPLLPESEVVTRAQALLAIDQSMCLVLPHTPELARLWVTTPSYLFDRRTPIEVMLSEGLPGIINVRSLLDGTDFW